MKTAIRRRVSSGMHVVLLLLLAAYSIFPIYMMTIESLKTVEEDVYGSPFIVRHPTTEWYEGLFEEQGWLSHKGTVMTKVVPFMVWAKNTGIAFAWALALILGTSLAAGYALGRLRPPGWRAWRRLLLATFLVPQTILFLPLYQLVYHARLDDNLGALVLTYPMLTVPFCVWLFSAYFQKLSPDIEDSAYIEGASRLTAFFRIVLPMSWPVAVACGLFALGVISSDFMLAGVFLPNTWHQTIAVGLATMDVSLEDLTVVSGVSLGGLPVLLVAAALATTYVRGLTAAMLEGA
ncbi:MAG TPA: carbohydrate ABC transporter permease [bacterium]|nr:carbohydrate ABC transporter permease [bacterium]HYM26123.1 carbohydrate ABC transporter permease [Vicinamibacterales bacterium]